MRTVLALVLVMAACGGDDAVHHLPDAPPAPDGGPDAATAGPVSITVSLFGTPNAGVAVYFQNADSSVVLTTTTDATGTATAMMEPGGFVTAVDPFRRAEFGVLEHDVRTFAGVKPGDHLQLSQGSSAVNNSFTVTVPNDLQGARYRLYSTCGGENGQEGAGSGAFVTPTFDWFLGDCSTADFGIVTFDTDSNPSKALFRAAVTVASGTQVDLAGPYVTPVDYALSYSSIPAGVTSLSAEHLLGTTSGVLARLVASADVTGPTVSLTFPEPPVPNALEVLVTTLSPSTIGTHHVIDAGPLVNPHTVSLADARLPDFTVFPTLDIAAHQVTWTADASTVQPDVVYADFRADHQATSTYWRWVIAAPYTGTSLALPVLPGPAAIFNAVAGDESFPDNLVTAKVPGGYDAIRASILQYSSPDFFAGFTGRVLVEDTLSASGRVATPPGFWQRVFGRR